MSDKSDFLAKFADRKIDMRFYPQSRLDIIVDDYVPDFGYVAPVVDGEYHYVFHYRDLPSISRLTCSYCSDVFSPLQIPRGFNFESCPSCGHVINYHIPKDLPEVIVSLGDKSIRFMTRGLYEEWVKNGKKWL